jgi:plastocyanin
VRLFWFALGLIAAAPGAAQERVFQVQDQYGRPLQHAVVTLQTNGMTAEAANDARVAVKQSNQQFTPRVLAVARGSTVRFPNMDITQHHVYSFSTAKTFELELYSGDDVEPVQFEQSGIVALGCNIHDWMLGYVFVTDDAVFGVTDADGRVRLDAGTGEVIAITWWHPASTTNKPDSRPGGELAGDAQTLTVTVGDIDPLAFEIDPLQNLFAPSP